MIRFAICTLCLVLSGCGQKSTPVDEITVKSSGVAISGTLPSDLQDDWYQWRGPKQNGHAGEQKVPVTWSETDNLLWRIDVPGRGHSSPVVVEDKVILATALEKEQQQMVIAYSTNEGAELWRTVVNEGNFPGTRHMHAKSTHANGTVACDGESVFIAFLHDEKIVATALDLQNGEEIWSTTLGAFNAKFGYAPSPLLYKSAVIFAADNQGGGYITAVDRASGEIAWRIERSSASTYSSPMVATVGGRDQLLISGNEEVCSYDPSTGKKLWRGAGTAQATCGTVVANNEYVFASGGYPEKNTVCFDAAGNQVWTNRNKLYEPSLILVGDGLYGVSDNGIAYCWSALDGTEHWKVRLGGSFSASPVFAKGNIYVSDLSGKTYVFSASTEGYESQAVNQLGSDCYASPAVHSGRIYLRTGNNAAQDRQEQLVCIGQN